MNRKVVQKKRPSQKKFEDFNEEVEVSESASDKHVSRPGSSSHRAPGEKRDNSDFLEQH